MKLSYRGNNYESTPAVSVSEGLVVGKYRGISIRLISSEHLYQSERIRLSYRGGTY